MPTILIVEDEASLIIGLEDALAAENYDLMTARNGELGLKLALEEKLDLIILDIMLPKLNGFELLQELRRHNRRVPVILLTAKGREQDKVKGFELGADDYVTKPFSVRELLARVKAVLKRAGTATVLLDSYVVNGIHFDFKAMQARRGAELLEFSPRELELLNYLIAHKGEVLSRANILESIWNYDAETAPTTRTIDNYIVKLRQKIEEVPDQPRHIITVHGRGYRFEA